MTLYVFLLPLMFFLIFSLVRLCYLCWLQHWPGRSAATARRTPIRHLLKPRTPRDCPACRLFSTLSSVGEPAPPPVRPWCEVKSRRGAPKRLNTEGFACPNRKCPTSASQTRTSTLWLAMAHMVALSRSRHFVARPAAPRSLLSTTPPCTV